MSRNAELWRLSEPMAQLSKPIDHERPLLHICYAPSDHAWVHGRMMPALGVLERQCHTRAEDELGATQLETIQRAVEECRFTILVASSAARWDRLTQFAAALAQHVGLECEESRFVIIARDFVPGSKDERTRLSLAQRALVSLDCSDEERTLEALARLRKLIVLEEPIDERPACPYPGLERFTETNRDLLFGRDNDKRALVQRIRARHTRILIVGPSGSGKSSLIHAAVLPELLTDYVVRVVPRGGALVPALRATIDALDVPGLAPALNRYVTAIRNASDAQIEQARAVLRTTAVRGGASIPDGCPRVVVIDPLEEIFADDDAIEREIFFALLGGLWSLPWCTVILSMRADFYGALMVERCWRELEHNQYPVAPLDESGLRAAIIGPAERAGVYVDPILVERLVHEVDRDRSWVPLPLLQVALKELWAHLQWRYLMLTDYERIVNYNQRGLAAVLAVHADSVVQALTALGDWAVAQRILLDLVHLGEGRPHTRRRRTVEDLRRSGDLPGQLERVLEQLVEGRLLTVSNGERHGARGEGAVVDPTADRPTWTKDRHVDLAHDTLITGWPKLASWVAERRDDLRSQRRLEARAASGGVLSASELPEFTRWIGWLATPAGQSLGASETLRALVRRSIKARRLRRGAFGIGLVVATAFAIIFGLQTYQLREERTKTQQKEREREREQQEKEKLTTERNELIKTTERVHGDLSERERELETTKKDLTQEQRRVSETARQAHQAETRAAENEQAFYEVQNQCRKEYEHLNRLRHDDDERSRRERDKLQEQAQWNMNRCERERDDCKKMRDDDQYNCRKNQETKNSDLSRCESSLRDCTGAVNRCRR